MNTILKIALLNFFLIVPGLSYLFLQKFGKNQFEIPIFYKKGIPLKECNTEYNKTHTVQFKEHSSKKIQLVYIAQWVDDEFYRQCNRIKSIHPKVMFTTASNNYSDSIFGNLLFLPSQEEMYKFANCSLVLGRTKPIVKPLFNQLVLIDKHKQIRGYYDGSKFEDMDRLDIELSILNKKK